MIPGKIIRISDKVTFKLWPKLEGRVLKTTPSYSIQLKPMTVSPSYPNLHPGELVPVVQQVVITIRPLPKTTDKGKDNKEDRDEEDQEHSTASYSSEEHYEEWEVSSLSTESEVSAPNPSDPADQDDGGREPPSPSTPSTVGLLDRCPVCGRQRSRESPHPSGKLKRIRDDSTPEMGRKSKKKRED